MSAARVIRTPATLHRMVPSPVKDELGDVVLVPTDIPTYAAVQQLQTEEQRENRTILTSTWLGFLRADVEPHGADTLTVGGVTYTFDGDPWLVTNPRTGRVSHYEVRLRKVV